VIHHDDKSNQTSDGHQPPVDDLPPQSFHAELDSPTLQNNSVRFSRPNEPIFKFNYFRSALFFELALLVGIATFVWLFWYNWCPDGVEKCVGTSKLAPAHYLILSLLRPLLLTPHILGSVLAAQSFSTGHAILLAALGSALSTIPVYGITYFFGRRLVIPWMSRNLPSTLRFMRTQDYKLIFAARLIPIFPFDLVSFVAGAFNLSPKRVFGYTLIGILPECVFMVYVSSPHVTLLGRTVNAIGLTAGLTLAPLLIFEWQSRKRGRSLWSTLTAAYKEIIVEASLNNQIVRRNQKIDPTKTPVLLLYGFFSSQRTLNVIERQLIAAGFDVLSFNLGGLFGTFFTHGVMETASFIDYKLKRQMDRHGFKKVHIVAHSKGTLVALWWVLKLGGNKYCDKVVGMAPPCNGSYYTYLALVTPLGFFWRDVWQMRPGSRFLKFLKDSDVPDNLQIHQIYSVSDSVARGKNGVFVPRSGQKNIHNYAMNGLSHFEFIMRREPIKEVIKILKDDPEVSRLLDAEDQTPLSSLTGDIDSAS
jgi:uncharacterized membrane protein YdjX (TVP38/TMEM64 family)